MYYYSTTHVRNDVDSAIEGGFGVRLGVSELLCHYRDEFLLSEGLGGVLLASERRELGSTVVACGDEGDGDVAQSRQYKDGSGEHGLIRLVLYSIV